MIVFQGRVPSRQKFMEEDYVKMELNREKQSQGGQGKTP